MRKTDAKNAVLAFAERPIAFYPAFAKITGRVTAALFLSQLFYWTGRGADPDGWIWKTQAEWEEETCLSRCEQETARKTLRELGLIEERLASIPARLYYRLDLDKLAALLSNASASVPEPRMQDCGNPAYRDAGFQQANSEITTETTDTREAVASQPTAFPGGPPPRRESAVTRERSAVRRAIQEHFQTQTGLTMPAGNKRRGLASQWWNPIREICALSGWDVHKAQELVDQSLKRLDGLTVSDPNSILKTARAIAAEGAKAEPAATGGWKSTWQS